MELHWISCIVVMVMVMGCDGNHQQDKKVHAATEYKRFFDPDQAFNLDYILGFLDGLRLAQEAAAREVGGTNGNSGGSNGNSGGPDGKSGGGSENSGIGNTSPGGNGNGGIGNASPGSVIGNSPLLGNGNNGNSNGNNGNGSGNNGNAIKRGQVNAEKRHADIELLKKLIQNI